MERHNKIKTKSAKTGIFLILICICTIFMSVGYAAINSITLNIEGEVIAKVQDGVFITDVNYVSDVNANVEQSEILNIYQTNLNSNIFLSDTDSNSSITYEITVYNSSNYDYKFEGVEYLIGENTYSNENIIFNVSLNEGDVLKSGETLSFTITFNYTNNELSNNNLISILNFKFSLQSYVVAEYEYTGNYETFIAPHDGIYKLEVWGAQGGSVEGYNVNNQFQSYHGGYGGYSVGLVSLQSNDELFVVVGSQGEAGTPSEIRYGGYNGGGHVYPQEGDNYPTNRYVAGGGGATHISTNNRGELYNYEYNISEILIVAGGGGGAYMHTAVGYAGNGGNGGGASGTDGETGESGKNPGTGGTQTSPGSAGGDNGNVFGLASFGKGGNVDTAAHGSAGGSGFYGGGGSSGKNNTSAYPGNSSGAGGSGYIGNSLLTDKFMVGYSCTPSSVEESKTISTNNTSEEPISQYVKIGDGYAKITFVKEIDN